MDRKPSSSAGAADGAIGLSPTLDLQHAWYEIRRGPPWKSMALVAVDDGPPPVALAQSFGELATEEKTRRILVVNASIQNAGDADLDTSVSETYWRDITPGDRAAVVALSDHVDYLQLSRLERSHAARLLAGAPHTIAELASGSPAFDGVIFAMDSLLVCPAATPLARGVDIVVLCVRLGTAALESVRRITEIIGAEKVVGSLALRP